MAQTRTGRPVTAFQRPSLQCNEGKSGWNREAKLSPQSLANAVDTALAAPKPAAARIDLTGIETTARLILAMVEGKRG